MIDLNKRIYVKIIEDEDDFEQYLRGGIGNNLIQITTSSIKRKIEKEIKELEYQLKYASEYLPFDKLFEIDVKLEVLKKVLIG